MPDGLFQRGRVWWVKFQHLGVSYRQSTGETDRRKAEREARRIRAHIEEHHGPARAKGLELRMLEAIDIARVRNEGMSDRRVQTIEGVWTPMLRHWGEHHNAQALSIGDVLAYVGARRQQVSVQTVRREVQALVRTLAIAKRDRMIPRVPFDATELPVIRSDPKNEAQSAKLWSVEQIESVLGALSSKALTAGHREICRLIMLTGLRIEEVWRVRFGMIVPAVGGELVGVLHLPAEAAKWAKPRRIPLVREACDIIERMAPIAPRKINKALKLASEKVGLPGVLTPRDLRAFYLSTIARLSSDPVVAQRLAGHTSITTTGLYLQAEESRIAEAALKAQRFVLEHARGAEHGCTKLARTRHSE